MQGTAQQPDPTRPGVGIPIKVRLSEPAHVDEAIPNQPARQEQGPRRMRIMPYILEKYGFAEGCEGHKQAGLQGARDHSETCRVRIMEAIRHMGLILNEAGVRCLLSIQATDTIGGDSKREQGVAHEEDESLDHWPWWHGTTSRGRHLIRKKKCSTSRASKCTGKFFVRTLNGAEFQFFAHDEWTSTRETTTSTITEADLCPWNLTHIR